MDTDLWYKTYRLPRDARFTYALSPNDSLVPLEDIDENDIMKRVATFRSDPLNKVPAMQGSIVELPGAPLLGRAQRTCQRGTAGEAKIKRAILKNDAGRMVYTPRVTLA